MVEISHLGQRDACALRLHARAHLVRRAVCERRAEHALRVHARAHGVKDSLRQNLGLPRSGRRKHKMAPRVDLDNPPLLIGKLYAHMTTSSDNSG